MDLVTFGVIAIGILCAVYFAYWVLNLRQIVDIKFADVVVRKTGTSIYSADEQIPNREATAVYYNIPSWIPYYGCIVKRMPLEIIQIPIKNYETFAKSNARFIIDVSVYCRIVSVSTAAQKFPGTSIEDFKKGMTSIIISAVRKTTANYAIEDIISKRKEISDEIYEEVKEDFVRWGVELTNVAVENIADSETSSAISDISAKKEAEINSLSRQEIAIKSKQAEIVEAENRELAEKRKIQANEQIAIREQEKEKTVASMTQEAITKKLEVERTEKVTRAEIDAQASIRTADGIKQSSIIKSDGEKQSSILRADGEKQAIVLKAEGSKESLRLEGDGKASQEKAVGTAQADVIRAKKLAEAEGYMRLAEAQKAQQEGAERIRLIEKDEKIGIKFAEALAAAKISFYGGGDPKNFMDLFKVGTSITTSGSLNTFLDILKEENPTIYEDAKQAISVAMEKTKSEAKKIVKGDGKNDLPSIDSIKQKQSNAPLMYRSNLIDENSQNVVKNSINRDENSDTMEIIDGYPAKITKEKREKYSRFS